MRSAVRSRFALVVSISSREVMVDQLCYRFLDEDLLERLAALRFVVRFFDVFLVVFFFEDCFREREEDDVFEDFFVDFVADFCFFELFFFVFFTIFLADDDFLEAGFFFFGAACLVLDDAFFRCGFFVEFSTSVEEDSCSLSPVMSFEILLLVNSPYTVSLIIRAGARAQAPMQLTDSKPNIPFFVTSPGLIPNKELICFVNSGDFLT